MRQWSALATNGCGVPAENLSQTLRSLLHHQGSRSGAPVRVSPSPTRSWSTDMGGDISVQSSVGVGTEFTLRLPVGGPRPRGRACEEHSIRRRRGARFTRRSAPHASTSIGTIGNMQFLVSGDEAIAAFEQQTCRFDSLRRTHAGNGRRVSC